MASIVPRNSLVLVRLVLKSEDKIGMITVPTSNQEYCEAEVVAVGPDQIQAAGGVPSTADLGPGQRVLVKHKRRQQRPSQVGGVDTRYVDEGLKLQTKDQDDDGNLYLFEQSSIIAILTAEGEVPGTFPLFHPTD